MKSNFAQSVLKALPEALFIFDASMRLIFANQKALRTVSSDLHGVLGRYYSSFFPDSPILDPVIIQNMPSGIIIETGKWHIKISGGETEKIHVSLVSMEINDEGDKGLLVCFHPEFSELQSKTLIPDLSQFGFFSQSHALAHIQTRVYDIAQSEANVLITGETGTGKEILANVIHGLSKRCDGPLVKINCGAIPTELLEAELFGYKKGAFTDARTNKPGRFHLAKGGTIVLDEIGDMPLPMQVKLLRAIETRQVDPLGGTSSESIDVRIVSSTNQDLWEITEKGLFRKDLFFRINVMNLVIPPLRERVEDIQLLADMFVQKYCQKNSLPNIRISSAAMELLLRYPFYGNVRELHNILEYAIIISKGSDITPSHLPGYVFKSKETHKGNQEKEYIQDVLRSCGNNKGMAASILNIDRSTLWRKMKKYQI